MTPEIWILVVLLFTEHPVDVKTGKTIAQYETEAQCRVGMESMEKSWPGAMTKGGLKVKFSGFGCVRLILSKDNSDKGGQP